MCISDKNKVIYNLSFAMRGVGKILIALGLLCMVSCHEPTPEEAAQMALKEALEALEKGEHDVYLQHVDFGKEMDSVQTAYMRNVLRQHVGWRRSERAVVLSIDMVDVKMQEDSVCTVYYQYSFADGTREVGVQKMVRHGNEWKVRLRN